MNRAMSLFLIVVGFASFGFARSSEECFEDLKKALSSCEKLVKGDQQDVQMAMCMYKELKKKTPDCDQFYKDNCDFDKKGKPLCKIEPEATVKKPAATR